MVSPQQENGTKKLRNSTDFLFSSFRLWPLYPTDIKIGSKCPQHVLKHAQMQSETRGMKSFGAMSGALSPAVQKSNLKP